MQGIDEFEKWYKKNIYTDDEGRHFPYTHSDLKNAFLDGFVKGRENLNPQASATPQSPNSDFKASPKVFCPICKSQLVEFKNNYV